MIKAIVFDVDGVLIDLTIKKAKYQLQRDWGITYRQTKPFFTNEFILCLKGKADLKEVIAPYLKKWRWKNSIDAYLDYWFESQKDINDELFEDIKKLRKNGYNVYIATNQERYRAEYLLKQLGFKDLFDGFYVSSYIGEIKNNPTFFDILLKHIRLKPEEILFWDDSLSHIKSAKQVGIHSEQYHTYEDFKKKMKKYVNNI